MRQNDKKGKDRNLLARWRKQHPLMLAMAVTLAIVIVLGSTFAWFTQADHIQNVLRTKEQKLDVEVAEVFTPRSETEPGDVIEKVVHVENVEDMAGFVRVLVLAEIISEDGVVLPAIPGTSFTTNPEATFIYDLNITTDGGDDGMKWADGGDGYFYYLEKLEGGATTLQPLFTEVEINTALGDEYKNADMKIEIKVEAVETLKWKYRDAWFNPTGDPAFNSGNPPTDPAWLVIDDALDHLAL